MSQVTSYTPGSFCWVELMTSDASSAKSFYTQLFNWGVNDIPMGGGAFYHMLQLNGKDVGALYQRNKEQQNIPPHWACYVAVNNVDEAVKKVAALGGKTLMPPYDVFDAGRMTFIQDPTGAALALWQGKKNIGAGVINEPGSMCWSELGTNNEQAASAFYTQMFGWATKPMPITPPYTVFNNRGTDIGGMYKLDGPMAGIPPHWIPYFQVSDCDATVAKANAMGGKTVVPAMDIAVGRFAYLQDPQGAVFAVVKLNPM
jgi:uncharacterized protein